jgi:glycosyltransferase involved in cell wall biosynthesis
VAPPLPETTLSGSLPRIAYILDRFPAPSETFVLREIEQLLREQIPLSLVSISSRPPGPLPPGFSAAGLTIPGTMTPVSYRPSMTSPAFWTVAAPEALGWLRRVMLKSFSDRLSGRAGTPRNRPPGAPRLLGRVRGVRQQLKGFWAAGVCRRMGVKHVHAHFLGAPATAARAAAGCLAARFSISVHGSDLYRIDDSAWGNVRAAQFVITCTARNCARLAAEGPGAEHIHLAYHGLDLTRFSPGGALVDGNSASPEPEGNPCGVPVLSCVARLETKKGIDVLIDACAALRDGGQPYRCEILGDGSQRSMIADKIRRAGLSGHVYLHGQGSQDEVLALLRRATLMVLPCRVAPDGDEDGIPNVLVEAMAVGTPVVSTTAGAVTELIEPGATGSLVDPEDAAGLAAEICRLLMNPEERSRIAAAARRRVERDFDLSAGTVGAIFRRELNS